MSSQVTDLSNTSRGKYEYSEYILPLVEDLRDGFVSQNAAGCYLYEITTAMAEHNPELLRSIDPDISLEDIAQYGSRYNPVTKETTFSLPIGIIESGTFLIVETEDNGRKTVIEIPLDPSTNENLKVDNKGTVSVTLPVPPGTFYGYRHGDKIVIDPFCNHLPGGIYDTEKVVGLSQVIAPHEREESLRQRLEERQPMTQSEVCNLSMLEICLPVLFRNYKYDPENPVEFIEQFDAFLDEISSKGFNAIQLMPIVQHPGYEGGWSYDPWLLQAVNTLYNNPYLLHLIVDRCHLKNIKAIADWVPNHVAPGVKYYFEDVFPALFSDENTKWWGETYNWSNRDARKGVLSAARYLLENVGFDGLRTDAPHAIGGESAWGKSYYPEGVKFILELAQLVTKDLKAFLLAEWDGDTEMINVMKEKGLDSGSSFYASEQRHALFAKLAGVSHSYYGKYQDFEWSDVYKMLGTIFENPGIYAMFSEEHDQVGNDSKRAIEPFQKIGGVLTPEQQTAFAFLLGILPSPMFMFDGAQFGSEGYFCYIRSGDTKGMQRNVSQGRKEEHEANMKPGVEADDPYDSATRRKCIEDDRPSRLKTYPHKQVYAAYEFINSLRRDDPALLNANPASMRIHSIGDVVCIVRKPPEGVDADTKVLFFSPKGDTRINLNELSEVLGEDFDFNAKTLRKGVSSLGLPFTGHINYYFGKEPRIDGQGNLCFSNTTSIIFSYRKKC
jgi:1,4-alpha-glucan branching enzyme